jgi:hypothetical protein
VEGAQETEFTPRPWAWKILWSILLSLNSRMETEPSEEAQARRQLGEMLAVWFLWAGGKARTRIHEAPRIKC